MVSSLCVHELLLSPTLGANSDPDSTRMETFSLCALWSANYPLLLLGGTLTQFPALLLFPRLALIDTLKLYVQAHGAKVWPW